MFKIAIHLKRTLFLALYELNVKYNVREKSHSRKRVTFIFKDNHFANLNGIQLYVFCHNNLVLKGFHLIRTRIKI